MIQQLLILTNNYCDVMNQLISNIDRATRRLNDLQINSTVVAWKQNDHADSSINVTWMLWSFHFVGIYCAHWLLCIDYVRQSWMRASKNHVNWKFVWCMCSSSRRQQILGIIDRWSFGTWRAQVCGWRHLKLETTGVADLRVETRVRLELLT